MRCTEHGLWFTLIPEMRATDHDRYYNFFRMWPQHFDELLSKIEPFLSKKSWRKPICPGERLAITLRYMATGDSYMSLSYLFRVSDQAISRLVMETCHVIWRVLCPEVFEAPSEDLWLRVASEFQAMCDFPHCIGAVDGVCIHIKAFPHDGTFYFNYKKRHSITVLAVSDAKQRFLIVESGSCGSRGDAGIFGRSEMNRLLKNGLLKVPPPCPVEGLEGDLPFMFIGDGAYPRSTNFQTPFRGSVEPEEDSFNYRLSRARRSVENAFGILEKRLMVFHKNEIEGSPAAVKAIILCGLALHNFHLMRDDSLPPNRRYRPPSSLEDQKSERSRWKNENLGREQGLFRRLQQEVSQVECDENSDYLDGVQVREKLVEYFIDNPLPWQWKKLHLL